LTKPSNPVRPQGRWPAVLAVLAFCGLYYLLPEHLTVGPGWLLIAVAVALLIPSSVSHRRGRHDINNAVAYVLLGFLTLGLIGSLGLLIARLPQHKDPPVQLLEAAAALWLSNILLFASWYWRLDAGGPNARDRAGAHVDGAFLFPQMTMDDDLRRRMNEHEWSPGFVDYLFLAFNTSTALSPTDVPVLSRWAKALMVVQSMISLATIVLLAARAVNIL
jgi:hypothetical protein